MGMFDQADPTTDFFDSPEQGQEGEAADQQDNEEQHEDQQQDETVEESDVTPSEEQEQGETDLIAGKFKSQDDLLKAYKNLEKEFTKTRQQTKQQGQPPEQQFQQQQNQQQNDPNDLFWNHLQQDPLGTMNYLVTEAVKLQTAPIHEQRADEVLGKNIDQLAKDYKQLQTEDGLTSLFTKANEIAAEFGNEQYARSPRILKMAAQEMFGDSKADLYKKAKAEGVKQAEETRRTKQEVSAINTSKKPSDKPIVPEDELGDLIVGAASRKGVFGI